MDLGFPFLSVPHVLHYTPDPIFIIRIKKLSNVLPGFWEGLITKPCNQIFSWPNSQKMPQSFPCSPTSCDCSITMATIIYSVNSSRDRYLLPAGSTLGLEFLEEFRGTPVRSQRHLLCCFEQLLDLWLLHFFKRAEIKFSLHANYCQQPADFQITRESLSV